MNTSPPSFSQLQQRWQRYLRPPGLGLHVVKTGEDIINSTHKKIFGTSGPAVTQLWHKELTQIPHFKGPLLLGLPADTGGGIHRGANWGPLLIRDHYLGSEHHDRQTPFLDIGDIWVNPHLISDKILNQNALQAIRLAMYDDANCDLPVAPLDIASDFLRGLYQLNPKSKVLGLGGDHSVSYPLVNEYLALKKRLGQKVGVLHFDAHTDLMDKRLGLEVTFGSWAYHILPQLASPDLLVQVGLRSSGQDRSYWEKHLGVRQIWAEELKQIGASAVAENILQHFQAQKVDEIYISFDVDCIDSSYIQATGTPEAFGPAPHEPIMIISSLAEEIQVGGADIVEVAPFVRFQRGPLHPQPDATLDVSNALMTALLEALNRER